jgi:cytochrome b6-f complex iron-sulfur subunit
MDLHRRRMLGSLFQGTCALAALCAGCGGPGEERVSDAATCGVTPGSTDAGWVEVRLADHPALREPGGSVVVRLPEALLDVVVMHTASGCLATVWHLCSHGDCRVAYMPGESLLECPCHGSRFGEDGRVLRGPATRPLKTFATARVGESVWISRAR